MEDYGFIPGGTCSLEVVITTDWDYQNEQACMGYVAQQGLIWSFYDSNGLRWSRTDIAPAYRTVTLYPVAWDGNPWKLDVSTLYQIPECNVDFQYIFLVRVSEC